MINDWHPVVAIKQLDEKPVLGVRLLGEDIVVWRTTTNPQGGQLMV